MKSTTSEKKNVVRSRAREILRRLQKTYSEPGPFAQWETPLQLVMVTMLSAQCTDARVNKISKALFARYATARDFAQAKIADLEKQVFSTGYYKSKARYAKGIGEMLEKEYGGTVPEAFHDLVRLPGISKKSACIIGAKAFGKMYGVAVDTHVARVAPRLGLVSAKSRDAMARELETLFLEKEYLQVNEYLITHGRAVCTPKTPKCEECVLSDICPKYV